MYEKKQNEMYLFSLTKRKQKGDDEEEWMQAGTWEIQI